jgi:hypothetical protein
MARLRRKLEDNPACPRYLLTEPGMGYRYQPEPDYAQTQVPLERGNDLSALAAGQRTDHR